MGERESVSTGRRKGSGAPKVAGADAIVDEARELTIGPIWGPCPGGPPPLATGQPADNVRRRRQGSWFVGICRAQALQGGIDFNPPTQMKSQRARPLAQMRADCFRVWSAQMESCDLAAREIYWAARDMFRSGSCPGGSESVESGGETSEEIGTTR